MKRKRNHYSGKEKVAIIRKHLVEKVPVSELCEEYILKPTVYYRWQKQFFESGELAFKTKHLNTQKAEERKIEALENKLVVKNEVLSELMEEHIKLKKNLGEI